MDDSKGRGRYHGIASGPSYKSLGQEATGKGIGPYNKEHVLQLDATHAKEPNTAEAQEGIKTQLSPQESPLSGIHKNEKGKEIVVARVTGEGHREGKGKRIAGQGSEAGDHNNWEEGGTGFDGDESDQDIRYSEIGEPSVGKKTSYREWAEQSTVEDSEQDYQDQYGSSGVKDLQEEDKVRNGGIFKDSTREADPFCRSKGMGEFESLSENNSAVILSSVCSDSELEQIRGWIERATEAWKMTSPEGVQEREVGILQCEPLAVLAPDLSPDGREMVMLDSKELKMKEASRWVMRRTKMVSRGLGVSCRGFEDEITDLFGRIEKASRQQSGGKRESGSRLHRELQKLKSTVNYEMKRKAGKQKGVKALNVRDLDKFLKSIGKNPNYVDLEANPSVGKDQPPDLAALVPSDATVLPGPPEEVASLRGPEINNVSVNNKSTVVAAKAIKPSSDAQNGQSTNPMNLSSSFADPEKFVEEILEKTSAVVLSEIKEETIKQQGEQLGIMVSNSIRKRLSLELKNLATIYKNTAYTEGFHAGTHRQPKRL
ncbi:hypothetical protein F0562_002873 [Nyssa sinensis]|uniref:Uncharacterized protein n=1 Tax=Nyssa sinensis TaxID=561372 RepID=A0A5J5BUD8_9ASTE|nr:hypothetical protein F0562_002873 [Nyssa sinensis]